MAAPSFVDAGTGATDAGGAWSYTCQASQAAGRVFIVHIFQDGGTVPAPNGVQVTGATNIESLSGTANTWTRIGDVFTVSTGFPGDSYLTHLLIGRATSTSAPTISGSNNTSEDVYIRSYQFTDVNTGTTLADVIEQNGTTTPSKTNGSGTDIADAGVTTTGPDRLALQFVAVNDDNAVGDFTGETGGDWTEAVAEYAEASGTDATIGLQTARLGAAFYYDSNSQAFSILGDGGADEAQAQSFTVASGGTVATVGLWLKRANSPTDDVVVEIRTDSSGVPSSTVLGSGTIAASSLPVSFTYQTVPVVCSLSASTTYWIVVSRSGARDITNTADIDSFLGYGGGAGFTRDSGTWSDSNTDFKFVVDMGGGTIDGGSYTMAASDGWGVVGFALIGTTVTETVYVPRYAFTNFQNPGVF